MEKVLQDQIYFEEEIYWNMMFSDNLHLIVSYEFSSVPDQSSHSTELFELASSAVSAIYFSKLAIYIYVINNLVKILNLHICIKFVLMYILKFV